MHVASRHFRAPTAASRLWPAARTPHGSAGAVRVAAGAALLLLSACSIRGSGFQYVTSRQAGTYFKVPATWKVYDTRTVLEDLAGGQEQEDMVSRLTWATHFDAAPKPSLDHFGDASSPHPTGFAWVRTLAPEEREVVSLSAMKNIIVDVDEGLESGEVVLLDASDLELEGLRGRRLQFTVRLEDGGLYAISQTVLVDSGTSSVYVFAIGCEARCYAENEDLIQEIVSSWTVKER